MMVYYFMWNIIILNVYIWSEVYKLFDLIHLILCFTLQVHLNIDLKKYAKCLNSRYLYFVDMLVKVAFTATRTLSQSFTTETAVVFSNILTNIGGGYNAVTGIFTAPLGGIYFFDCKLTDNQNRDGTSIFFVKNGAYQGSHVGNDGPTNLFRSSSSSIMLELIPGDMVWLKVYGVSSFHTKTIIGEQILTGFLLWYLQLKSWTLTNVY